MAELIQFKFNPEKAVQAAALLLKLHKNIRNKETMAYLGLLKMLYVSDRLALDRMDQPITGDRYFSMKNGPVLSIVYDLIKGKPVSDALEMWSQFISPRKKYDVSLISDPGDEELCEEEEDIIREVYSKLGHLDPFIVAEWTHFFPEWKMPNPTNSRVRIEVEELLRCLGRSSEEIENIRLEALREAYLDEVLND